MQSKHKNTFRTKHDGISSELIAKQLGVVAYMGTPGGQIPKILTTNKPNNWVCVCNNWGGVVVFATKE